MKPSRPTYRDLIYVFMYEFTAIFRFFKGDEKYDALLRELEAYEDLPFQKDLLKSLGLSRPDLMNLMNDLYRDFEMRLCGTNAYLMTMKEVWFLPSSFKEHWAIGVDELEIIPRVGETVFLPFLINPGGGAGYFTVEEIIHEIDGGVQRINIHMRDTMDKR